MQNLLNTYLEKFKLERKTRRRLIAGMLAVTLVFGSGVYWQMRMTGAALTNETYCGLEEHTHTEECYEEEQLICGVEEEHVHTIECMTDEHADVETSSDWEATLPRLTGGAADDVVAIAKSQLGYKESTANFVLDDNDEHKGYTRYGAWYGNEYGDWDGMFAAFVYNYAGLSKSEFPTTAGANAWVVSLKERELYNQEDGYIPTAGDAVFFDRTNSDNVADHVGVIIYVDENNNKITVVEGNSNDAVERNEYSLNDSAILGYGVLTEKEVVEEEAESETEVIDEEPVSNEEDSEETTSETPEEEENPAGEEAPTETSEADENATTSFEAENSYVTATVELTDALPEDYTFVAKVVDEDSEEYSNALELAAEFIEDEDISIASAFVLDMHFLNEAGEETEITGSADITLSFLQDIVSKSNDARVLHIKDDGTVEDVTRQILFTEDQSAVEEATLTTTSFSEFTIVSLRNSGMINLVDYIEEVNNVTGQSAFVTVELYNADHTKVERTQDASGNDVITVTEDAKYLLSLIIRSSAGFPDGTYAYELPEGVNLEAGASGPVTSDGGDNLGTWTVVQDEASGRFYFKIEIDQGEKQFTDVNIQFTEDAAFNRQANNELLGGATLIVNPKNPDSSVDVKKSSDRDNGIYAIDEKTKFHDGTVWTASFDQTNTSLVGTRFADFLEDNTSTFLPYYVQYSGNKAAFKTWLDGRTTLPGYSTFAHFDLDQSESKGKYKNIVIKVTNSNGDYYEWAVDWTSENGDLARFYRNDTGKLDKQAFYDYIAGNYSWDASKIDDIVGFEYLFPSIVSKANGNALWVNSSIDGTLDDSGNAVFNLSDTASWDKYTVDIKTNVEHDVLPSLDTGNGGIVRLVYYNGAYVKNTNDTSDSVSQYFVQGYTSNVGIVKNADRGTDGSVNWKVTATLPGGRNIPFQVTDRMLIRTGTSSSDYQYIDISQYNYADLNSLNVNVNIPADTTINGVTVKAGTYKAYDISNSSAIPEDALFVYRYYRANETTAYAYYTFGMVCQCDSDHCSDWDASNGCQAMMVTSPSGKKYCACWTVSQKVTVDITYTTPADKVRELNDTYGMENGAVLRNDATLYTGKYTGVDNGLDNRNWLWSANTSVNLSLIGKRLTGTPVYTDDDDPDNDFVAQYTITVNEDFNPLLPADVEDPVITITDTLSDTLTLKVSEKYPFTITAYEDANDETGRVLTSGDYTIDYDVSPASFKIDIKDPGIRKYVITYYAQLLNPQPDQPYSNTATLSWNGKNQTVTTSVARLINVTTTGETYAVSLRKISDTNETLAGAEFGLYDASGKEMASGTTDAAGNLTFRTIAGTGANALILEPYTLYYLQEKTAPTGYILNEKKYYFSFRKYGNTTAEHTAAQEIFVESIPETVDQNDYTLITNVPLQITNEAEKYEFTLKKVDASNTETVLKGAEFILYRLSGTEGSKEYARLENGKITGWTSYESAATTITVGQNGLAEVKDITFGTYYLEEKKAPDGYNLLSAPIEFIVSLEGTFSENSADASVSTDNNVITLTVENEAGYSLPNTGGVGTQGYVALGLILALSAAAIYLFRRRAYN